MSEVEPKRSESRRNAGLAMKYRFEDEWLDSLNESMTALASADNLTARSTVSGSDPSVDVRGLALGARLP